jgi:hypothetical protein
MADGDGMADSRGCGFLNGKRGRSAQHGSSVSVVAGKAWRKLGGGRPTRYSSYSIAGGKRGLTSGLTGVQANDMWEAGKSPSRRAEFACSATRWTFSAPTQLPLSSSHATRGSILGLWETTETSSRGAQR